MSLTSSFQRNEALSLTDNFNKLSEWPQIHLTSKTSKKLNHNRRDLQITEESKAFKTSLKLARQRDSSGATPKASELSQIQTQHIKRYADLGSMKQRLSFLKAKIKESSDVGVHSIEQSTPLQVSKGEERRGHEGKPYEVDRTVPNNPATASSDRRASSSNMPEAFLKHAEKILFDVEAAIRAGAESGPAPVSGPPTAPAPLQWRAGPGTAPRDPEIALLLQGLPEAYEGDEGDEQRLEEFLSDAAVAAALREGGPPPAQLRLPHFYAHSQVITSCPRLPCPRRDSIPLRLSLSLSPSHPTFHLSPSCVSIVGRESWSGSCRCAAWRCG
jgi:hypothetical protein